MSDPTVPDPTPRAEELLRDAHPTGHNVIDFGRPPKAPFLVVYSDHSDTEAIRDAVMAAIRAALAASPTAPGLDVRVLAAAAQNHETSGIHGPLHCSLACGATLAAEYARLHETPQPEEKP